jgi:UDP-galactopyranose mutase
MVRGEFSGFGPATDAVLGAMARSLLTRLRIKRHAAWLYTPMALAAARATDPQLLVYDCMDELSGFLGAPPGLIERERSLLAEADVVFTGGPSLYRAKRIHNPHVFCFPSSVDVAHFARARDLLADHPEQRSLARPRLGFFGVIDERLDRELLAALTTGNWQIAMVGPVLKIARESLPRADNLHYFGRRPYRELPDFLAGWDVCLLPFAMNDATRFISPTKTLEYMAARKPIATTPIRDVVDVYSDLVYVGDGPDGFMTACAAALRESESDRVRRITGMRMAVERTSWDATATAMEIELERAVWRCRPRQRAIAAVSFAGNGIR